LFHLKVVLLNEVLQVPEIIDELTIIEFLTDRIQGRKHCLNICDANKQLLEHVTKIFTELRSGFKTKLKQNELEMPHFRQ